MVLDLRLELNPPGFLNTVSTEEEKNEKIIINDKIIFFGNFFSAVLHSLTGGSIPFF